MIALAVGCPHEKPLDALLTVIDPAGRFAAIGWLGLTMLSDVWALTVPWFATVVNNCSSCRAVSQLITGTATDWNFVETLPDVTDEDVMTSTFPVASAVVAAESLIVCTMNP